MTKQIFPISGDRAKVRRYRDESAKRQGMLCWWCEQPMNRTPNDPGQVSADHIIEMSRGGGHSRENIVAACLYCNTSRSTVTNLIWKGLLQNVQNHAKENVQNLLDIQLENVQNHNEGEEHYDENEKASV